MTTYKTSREIPATPLAIFAAFTDQERLLKWWGPAGFTNTASVCEFEPGGRWVMVMHGPDGRSYPNELVFAEIDAPRKVVVDHVSEPIFQLTVELVETTDGTLVSWTQVFENDEIGKKLESIVVPANNQNLERLEAEVLAASA